MIVDPKQLRYLRAVIEQKSFARAAELLGISQPALSRSIANLEAQVGVTVLVRGRHGATPTAFGQALAARSAVIDSELRQAEQDMQRLKSARAGHLVVGSTMVPAAHAVPQAVASLKRERPGLVVKIVEQFENDLLMSVQLGDIDLMVGPTDPGANAAEDLIEQTLFDTSVAVITRRGHRLARRRRLEMHDLRNEHWVGPITSTSLHRYVDMLVKRAGMHALKTAVQTDSLHQLKMLIARSDFYALLPPEMIDSEIKSGLLEATPLRAEGNEWPHGYRLQADRARDPSVRDFLVHLKRACAGMRRPPAGDRIR